MRFLLYLLLCITMSWSLSAAADDPAHDHAKADDPAHHGEGHAEVAPAEHLKAAEAMCSEGADAMAARQHEKSLYERLGGEEKIHECVVEIVRLHDENPVFTEVMEGVDREKLIARVTQWIVANSGGPDIYEGADMETAHAHLALDNAHFLAAGGDVQQAMINVGYGEQEIQEIVCLLVSHRKEVVVESDREL